MKNPFNHPAMIDISLLTGRIVLGLYMVIAGWKKMADQGLSGFAGVTAGMRPHWLPESIARPYGYALPVLELVCGLAVLVGLFTRIASGFLALLLLSIFIAVVSANGITGGAPGSFHFSIVFAALAFIIAIIGPGRLALDPLYFGTSTTR